MATYNDGLTMGIFLGLLAAVVINLIVRFVGPRRKEQAK
jgi:hypothetical protein